jgi:hypothetical protein
MQIVKQVYLPENPFWGLGDVIRGYLSLANLCRKYGFVLEFDYSLHPISTFLQNKRCTKVSLDPSSIPVFNIEDEQELHDILQKIHETNAPTFIFTITTNMWYLSDGVSDETRQALRDSIHPTDDLTRAVEDQLASVGTQFTAIHVRMGDRHLIDGFQYVEVYEKIYTQIKKIQSEILIVFSDDPALKRFLDLKGILVSSSHPCHLSGSNLDLEHVKQTLVDFFCLSRAKHIYKWSMHGYGSGFVDWCADIFKIPTTQLDVDHEQSICII